MIMCSCNTLLYQIIFLIFIYFVYGEDTSVSTFPDSLKYYKEGQHLKFGIKTLTKTTIINAQLYLTLVLNTTQYQCQLNVIEAPNWPYIWHWCNMDQIATSYCENNNYEDDYSIIVTNQADRPIFVDLITIETEQDSISIDTFYGKNINSKYPSVRPEEIFLDPLGFVYGTIAVENMSILINLKAIIKEQAFNLTIIENEITKCRSDIDAWLVLVVTEVSWHDAEKHCIDMYHSHLVTIDSDNKMQLLFEASSQYNIQKAWIGLIYINSSWIWIDGTSCDYADEGDCANDKHWARFEPTDNSNEWCVHVTADDDHFTNTECEMPFAFFCSLPNNASVLSLAFKTTAVPNKPTNNTSNIIRTNTKISNDEATNDRLSMVIILAICVVVLCFCVFFCILCIYWKHRGDAGVEEVKYENIEIIIDDMEDSDRSIDVRENSIHIASEESGGFVAIRRDGSNIKIESKVKEELLSIVNREEIIILKADCLNHLRVNVKTKSNMESESTSDTTHGTFTYAYDHRDSELEDIEPMQNTKTTEIMPYKCLRVL